MLYLIFFRTRAFHKLNAFEHGNNLVASVLLLEHLTPNEFNFCNTFNLHRFRVYQFYLLNDSSSHLIYILFHFIYIETIQHN